MSIYKINGTTFSNLNFNAGRSPQLRTRPQQRPNLRPQITVRLNKISTCNSGKLSLFSLLEGIKIEELTGAKQVWAEFKARIAALMEKFRKPASPGKEGDADIERSFPSARMTNNRMQALDGVGYRQCYMDKLREVASESDKPEANRDYWFGKEELVPSDDPQDKPKATSTGKHQALRDVIPSSARVTSTRLRAYVETLPKPEKEEE